MGYIWFFSIIQAPSEKQLPINHFERKKWIGLFVLFIIILEFFFSYYLRIYRREVFEIGQISFSGITFINSFVVVLELGASMLYYTTMRKLYVLRSDWHIWLFCTIMLIPFIIRDLFHAGYDVLILQTSYQTIECINLSYRALILASLTEELLYRGVIFDELCLYFKEAVAAIIQSMLFTFAHSERWLLLAKTGDLGIAINLIAVFFMGLLSAFLRKKTRSLLPSILMHFALNAGIYDLFLAAF